MSVLKDCGTIPVFFCHVFSDLRYQDIFERLVPQIGIHFEKHPLHSMCWRLRTSYKACLLFYYL